MIINPYIFKQESEYPNLVANYRFNNDVLDFAGSHLATEINSPSYAAGLWNSAIEFDGTNSAYVAITDANDFAFGNNVVDSAYSISTLLYLDSTPSYSIIADKSEAGKGSEWRFYVTSDKVTVTLFSQGATTAWIGQTSTSTLSTGTWYHVAFTYDGSGTSAGIKIYINGVLETQDSSSAGTYVALKNTGARVCIGTIGLSGPYYTMDGRLQDTCFWNKELTGAELSAIYTKNTSNLYTNQ